MTGGSCAHGAPSVAVDAQGREYLAFLAATFCGDTLTPYLVITSRGSARYRWAPLTRVVPPAWKFGFDDAPDLAVDERDGRLYLAWTRSLSKQDATVVVSTSVDRGRTWSEPKAVSRALQHPHHATLAVAPGGALYVAGIDAKVGLWISRSIASDPTPTVVVYSGLAKGGLGPTVTAKTASRTRSLAHGRVIANELDVFTTALPDAPRGH